MARIIPKITKLLRYHKKTKQTHIFFEENKSEEKSLEKMRSSLRRFHKKGLFSYISAYLI